MKVQRFINVRPARGEVVILNSRGEPMRALVTVDEQPKPQPVQKRPVGFQPPNFGSQEVR